MIRWGWGILGLLVSAIVLVQGYWILSTRVDVPYWDDWSMIASLTREFNFRWVWFRHNDHRDVVSKTAIWILSRVDGWNQVHHAILNYILFCGFIFWFFRRFGRGLSVWQKMSFGLLAAFPLSTQNWENFCWGEQLDVHSWLWLSLATVSFLSVPIVSRSQIVVLSLLGSLLPFTQIQGVFTGIGIGIVGILLFRSEWRTRSKLLTLWLAASVLSLQGYTRPSHHPEFNWPVHSSFWSFFFTAIGRDFGYLGAAVWPGSFIFVALVATVSWAYLTCSRRVLLAPFMLGLFVTLSAIAALAVGRSGFGNSFAGFSRYFELGAFTLPLWFGVISFGFEARVVVRNAILSALVGLWICGFHFTPRPYLALQLTLESGLACLRNQVRSERSRPDSRISCPELFPDDLRPAVSRALELKLSATRLW